MATTKARKMRRAKQVEIQTVIDTMIDTYMLNPNAALQACFDKFGKERFTNALRVHLHDHVAKVAMELAVKSCLRKDIN